MVPFFGDSVDLLTNPSVSPHGVELCTVEALHCPPFIKQISFLKLNVREDVEAIFMIIQPRFYIFSG